MLHLISTQKRQGTKNKQCFLKNTDLDIYAILSTNSADTYIRASKLSYRRRRIVYWLKLYIVSRHQIKHTMNV